MLILLTAGLGTGRWEFYFILTILILVVGYAFFLNVWTIMSFSYVQDLQAKSTVKGGAPILRVGIYNDKPFPFTMMKIIVQTPMPGERVELSFNLDPNSNIYYDIPMRCAYRGVYDVGMTILEVNDVFGLLRMRFDLRRLPYYRQRQLIVYPRLLQLPFLPAGMRDAKYEGGGAQHVTEDGESFSDTRQYHFGDPFKRVHRILSMRKRQLFVKRYDVPMETAAIVALDTRDNGLEGEDSLRYADIACECATAIADYCLRAGYVVELMGSDENTPTVQGKSSRDFSKLYDHLAVISFGGAGDISASIRGGTRRHPNLKAVYVIAPGGTPELSETFSTLIQAGCNVKLLIPKVEDSIGSYQSKTTLGVSEAFLTSADDIASVLGDLV